MGEPRPLDVLCLQIAEAWEELLLARADAMHSPNADSIRTEEYAELRVNRLLERLAVSMTAEQMAAALARPMREKVDAG